MDSPFEWQRWESNPVLTPGQWYDTDGVADPFSICVTGDLWMLYEGLDPHDHATINAAHSTDGLRFEKYAGNPIFDEYYHQSFPAVLAVDDVVYIVPQRPSNIVSLWKTDRRSFPEGWRHVWDAELNVRCADTTLYERAGHYYLFTSVRQRRDYPLYFIKVLVTDDIETPSMSEVGDIYPTDPDSPVLGERSAFLHDLGESVALYHQTDDELDRSNGTEYGGNLGDSIHGGVIHDLSSRGFRFERFDDNPILSATTNWEGARIHSFSITEYRNRVLGYFDGHNKGQWQGIGVVSGKPRASVRDSHSSVADQSRYCTFDDFADGELHARNGLADETSKKCHLVRPVWTVMEGSPSVRDSALRFPGDGRPHSINKYSDIRIGEWEFDVEFESSRKDATLDLYVLAPGRLRNRMIDALGNASGTLDRLIDRLPEGTTATDFWRVRITSGERLRLQKATGGRIKTCLDATVASDRAVDTVRLSRNRSGKWRLSCNESKVGSIWDRFHPSVSAVWIRTPGSESAVGVHRIELSGAN